MLAGYKTITSPYDGVITKRTFHRGAFIRAAERSREEPLLVVERTDLLRAVVQVPDLDVPWVQRGSKAKVEIDALPGHVFDGVVARMADAEDPQSRTMRVEIDLPNPTGQLRQGMYGQVTILLRALSHGLLVPSSCFVGPLKGGKGSVYVVRDGKAYLVPVDVASDDGVHAEIGRGLTDTDDVVYRYNGPIGEAIPVTIVQEQGQ